MSVKRQDNATVNRHTVRRILRYGKPFIWWFVLVLAIVLVVVRLELLQPAILERATDDFVGKYVDVSSEGISLAALKQMRADDLRGVILLGVQYFAVSAIIMLLTYLQVSILATVGQKIIYNMRTDIFRHLTRLHVGFFNDNPIGRLVTRVTNDCETVNEMFTSVIVNTVSSVFRNGGRGFASSNRSVLPSHSGSPKNRSTRIA